MFSFPTYLCAAYHSYTYLWQISIKSAIAVNSRPNQTNHNSQWKVCTCHSFTDSKCNHTAVGWHENKKLFHFHLLLSPGSAYQTHIQQEEPSITSTCFIYIYTHLIFLCEKLRISFCSLHYVNDKALAGQCSPGWVVHIVHFFTEKYWIRVNRSILK